MNPKKAKQLRRMIYKAGSRHEQVKYLDAPTGRINGTTRIALGNRGVYLVLKKNLVA